MDLRRSDCRLYSQFKTTEGRASPLPYAKIIEGQGCGGGAATGLNQDFGTQGHRTRRICQPHQPTSSYGRKRRNQPNVLC